MRSRLSRPLVLTALLLAAAACGSPDNQITFEVEGDAIVDIWWGATMGPGEIMTTEDMNTAFATALPWSAEEAVNGPSIAQLVVVPSEYREGDTVRFTCRILIDGRLDAEATAQDQWGCTVSSVTP